MIQQGFFRRRGILKQGYARLIARGKPAKLALTTIMRKLIATLNAMVKTDTPWNKDFAKI
jgi:transposase